MFGHLSVSFVHLLHLTKDTVCRKDPISFYKCKSWKKGKNIIIDDNESSIIMISLSWQASVVLYIKFQFKYRILKNCNSKPLYELYYKILPVMFNHNERFLISALTK